MKPILYYCYDAYCGWCYGFSPVMRQLAEAYRDKLDFEVLSGGMILPEQPKHIRVMAAFIEETYPTVESHTGVRFGEDFLWHIRNPDLSDWYPNSEKPAIALCVFKEYYPQQQVAFASDLQYALKFEGRDLCDDEAYRHLLEKYQLPVNEFYEKLHSDTYKDIAHYEFALVQQLKVTGFPAVFIQVTDAKLYQVARGFTPYDTLKQRVDEVLNTITADL